MINFKQFIKESSYGKPRRVRRWVARYHLHDGTHKEIGFTARDRRDATQKARHRSEYADWRKQVKKVTFKSLGS